MKRSDITQEQVLEAARRMQRSFDTGNQIRTLHALMEMTGAPEKVALAAIEREVDRGVMEYGTSLASAWGIEDNARFWAARRAAAE